MKKLVGLGRFRTVVGVFAFVVLGMSVWAQKVIDDLPLPKTVCGNGVKEVGENCETCPKDVGDCDIDDNTGGDTDDNTEGGSTMDRAERLGQITNTSGRIKNAVDALKKGDKNGDNAHQLTEGDWNALLELLNLLQTSDVNISDLLNDSGTNSTPVNPDTVDITDLVPDGAIMAFEGDCPEGWVDYNKAEGRFIMGASSSNVLNKGGQSKVTLTPANLPPHRHAIFVQIRGKDNGDNNQVVGVGHYKAGGLVVQQEGYGYTEDNYDETMQSKEINILNPYITLHYCQKASQTDGECGYGVYQCENGIDALETQEHTYYYSWTCQGNGGESVSCKKCKNGYNKIGNRGCIKYDGLCGSREKTCGYGATPTNVRDTNDGHGEMWDCPGDGENPITATCRSCDSTYGYTTYVDSNGFEKEWLCGKASANYPTAIPWDRCRVFARDGHNVSCVAER